MRRPDRVAFHGGQTISRGRWWNIVVQSRQLPCKADNPVDRFFIWNQTALETTAIDPVPPPPNATDEEKRKKLQQPGPCDV